MNRFISRASHFVLLLCSWAAQAQPSNIPPEEALTRAALICEGHALSSDGTTIVWQPGWEKCAAIFAAREKQAKRGPPENVSDAQKKHIDDVLKQMGK